MRLGDGAYADDSGRLAQRRLSGQAHRAEREDRKLRGLHRARRSRVRLSVSVLRHDVGGVQPLARCVVAVRRRHAAAQLVHRARTWPSASTGRMADTARSSMPRCRKAPASFCCGSFRWPSGWSSTATTCRTSPTSTRTPTRHGLLQGEGVSLRRPRRILVAGDVRPREAGDRRRRARGVLLRQLGRWRARHSRRNSRRRQSHDRAHRQIRRARFRARAAASQKPWKQHGPDPAAADGRAQPRRRPTARPIGPAPTRSTGCSTAPA